MKCINKRIISLLLILILGGTSFGCGKSEVSLKFSDMKAQEVFSVTDNQLNDSISLMASDLCVTSSDVSIDTIDTSMVNGAGLFDITNKKVLYGSNLYEAFFPASITKVLTAYIVLKDVEAGKISLTDAVPISANTVIHESGVAACAFNQGDLVTVSQALNLLLIRSDNGTAVALAEFISGSVEEFSVRMNEEAKALGATGSNFVNPHGLTDANHYTTIYDLYLIFNEVVKYDTFLEIIQKNEYETTVTSADGQPRVVNCHAMHYFATGKVAVPEGVLLIGGKTGTTNAAGNCLILYSYDQNGNPFISITLGAQDRDTLYVKMSELLAESVKK